MVLVGPLPNSSKTYTESTHMKYSHKRGIAVLGVLPEAKNNYYWEYSQNLCGSGPNHIFFGGGDRDFM